MNLSPKISANRLTEQEYRKLRDRLSYSLLKLYDTDREKFFKEVILGEISNRKETASLVLGQLVHSLLAGEDGKFDEKFHIAQSIKPVGQMGELCDALYARSIKSLNEFNEQQDSFKVIFSDAVQKVKYDYEGNEVAFKKKDEAKILELFEGTNAEMYYNEQIKQAFGKTIVSISQIEQAERLVQKIKESPVTGPVVNQKTEWLDEVREIKGIEVYNELPILFDIDDVPCRSMPDKMIVSHICRRITPWDYKCSWQSSDSIEGVYLKYGYYIQSGLYDLAIRSWAEEHGIGDYEIDPMHFIFLDTGGFNEPFILKLSKDDIDRAMRGFKVRSYKYKGIYELMNEIAHHLSTGNWIQSYQEYKNKGIIPLQLPYGSRG